MVCLPPRTLHTIEWCCKQPAIARMTPDPLDDSDSLALVRPDSVRPPRKRGHSTTVLKHGPGFPLARERAEWARGRVDRKVLQANRTAEIRGSVWVTQAQLSLWSSLTHKPPVVEPMASRSPCSSSASAWR